MEDCKKHLRLALRRFRKSVADRNAIEGSSELWSPVEEDWLVKAAAACDTWDEVASRFPGRTAKVCRDHYQSMKRDRERFQKNRKAGNVSWSDWSNVEMDSIRTAIKSSSNWDEVASWFPGRTADECAMFLFVNPQRSQSRGTAPVSRKRRRGFVESDANRESAAGNPVGAGAAGPDDGSDVPAAKRPRRRR